MPPYLNTISIDYSANSVYNIVCKAIFSEYKGGIFMNDLAKAIGQRIRNYRTRRGLSQERLAELSGCHPTYIGQLERGEKNATLESVEKVAAALNISLSRLIENLGKPDTSERNIPLECYELLLAKTPAEQEQIIKILIEMDKYKDGVRS